jgi:hypothetical protein
VRPSNGSTCGQTVAETDGRVTRFWLGTIGVAPCTDEMLVRDTGAVALTTVRLTPALAVRFAAGLTDVAVRLAAGLVAGLAETRTTGFGAGVRVATGFAVVRRAGLTVRLVRLVVVDDAALTEDFAERAGVAATVFTVAARRVPVVDAFRVLRAAETFVVVVRADFVVLFGALLVALFGVALTADLAAGFAALTVVFTAGLALVLTAALAIRLDVAFTGVFATVVSSTPARMALRRTEVTPFIAAAFEPYGCEIATVEPFAACRVNRNLPALSLLMVNFAGTNASRCGADARCGRRVGSDRALECSSRTHFGRLARNLDAFE